MSEEKNAKKPAARKPAAGKKKNYKSAAANRGEADEKIR